jgi:hypothetical protein
MACSVCTKIIPVDRERAAIGILIGHFGLEGDAQTLSTDRGTDPVVETGGELPIMVPSPVILEEFDLRKESRINHRSGFPPPGLGPVKARVPLRPHRQTMLDEIRLLRTDQPGLVVVETGVVHRKAVKGCLLRSDGRSDIPKTGAALLSLGSTLPRGLGKILLGKWYGVKRMGTVS